MNAVYFSSHETWKHYLGHKIQNPVSYNKESSYINLFLLVPGVALKFPDFLMTCEPNKTWTIANNSLGTERVNIQLWFAILCSLLGLLKGKIHKKLKSMSKFLVRILLWFFHFYQISYFHGNFECLPHLYLLWCSTPNDL